MTPSSASQREPQPLRVPPVHVHFPAEDRAEILRRIDGLLKYADKFPVGSEELYVVKQTALDYLPTTINAYLALPPGYGYAPVGTEAKPALHVLWEQLCLLESKLDDIEVGIHRRHADGLLANGRFLQDRLAPRVPELDLEADEEHTERSAAS